MEKLQTNFLTDTVYFKIKFVTDVLILLIVIFVFRINLFISSLYLYFNLFIQ